MGFIEWFATVWGEIIKNYQFGNKFPYSFLHINLSFNYLNYILQNMEIQSNAIFQHNIKRRNRQKFDGDTLKPTKTKEFTKEKNTIKTKRENCWIMVDYVCKQKNHMEIWNVRAY